MTDTDHPSPNLDGLDSDQRDYVDRLWKQWDAHIWTHRQHPAVLVTTRTEWERYGYSRAIDLRNLDTVSAIFGNANGVPTAFGIPVMVIDIPGSLR